MSGTNTPKAEIVQLGDYLADKMKTADAARQTAAAPTRSVPNKYKLFGDPVEEPIPSEPVQKEPHTGGGLLTELRRILPAARPIVREGGSGDPPSQETLRGDPELVRAAVEAIPNSVASGLFETRNDYIKMRYAIRAALPDDPELACEVYAEWAERWDGIDTSGAVEGNPPGVIEADWRRMASGKDTYRVGAGYLYALAERHGGWTGRISAMWFDHDAAERADEIERKAAPTIRAVPFVSADPITFPRRQSIYGGHLFRKYVSATVAPGGVGNSTLSIAEALAIATGKPLLGVPVLRPGRVWIWNGEDPREEIERRVLAAKMRFGLSDDDIGGRLFLNSGRDLPLVLASQTRDGTTIHTPVVDGLVAEMRARSIDVLAVDPFVSSHQVPESDNGAIDLVAKRWASIADASNAAVELVHHSRKKADASAEIGPEDGRGASSLSNAARSVRTLAAMTPDEAKSLGIEDERRHRLFRFGGSKQNLAPRSDTTGRWMELVSQSLGNGGLAPDGVFEAADEVGVVMPYDAPALAPGRQDDLARFVAEMEPATWRVDPQARDAWIGVGVAAALGLDVESDKGAIKTTISRLCAEKRIRPVAAMDRHTRKLRRFYERAEQGVFS